MRTDSTKKPTAHAPSANSHASSATLQQFVMPVLKDISTQVPPARYVPVTALPVTKPPIVPLASLGISLQERIHANPVPNSILTVRPAQGRPVSTAISGISSMEPLFANIAARLCSSVKNVLQALFVCPV